MQRVFWVILAAAMIQPAVAGRFNRELSIGDAAPPWTELVGTDDQRHALQDFAANKAVLVVFTSNSCPYAQDAEQHLIEFSKKYADQGLAVVAINANKSPEDALPAMKERATERNYPFPYLYDETQEVAKMFGAKYTPEFYLLDSERKIAYMGALNDNPIGPQVKRQYVQDAINAVLAGDKPQVAETAPVGCTIRYERIRRRKKASSSP